MSGYDTIIYDFDGVLLKPADAAVPSTHRIGIDTALEQHGVNADDPRYDALREAMIDRDAAAIAEHSGDISVPDLWTVKMDQDINEQIRYVDQGHRTLYDDISTVIDLSSAYTQGIASNNYQRVVTHVLDSTDSLRTALDTVRGVTHDLYDDPHRKPDPYYLNTVAEDLAADHALMVGDSNTDLLAAEAAGMDTAFLWRPHRTTDTGKPAYTFNTTLENAPTYEMDTLSDLSHVL